MFIPFRIFFSYSRRESKNDSKFITDLFKFIQGEIRSKIGDPKFKIFKDDSGIEYGKKWFEYIKKELRSTTVFLAVVTPHYVKSDYCRNEFTIFQNTEKTLNRDDLAIPIYLMKTDFVEYELDSDDWLKQLMSHQCVDLRNFRTKRFHNAQLLELLGELTDRICNIRKSIISGTQKTKKFSGVRQFLPLLNPSKHETLLKDIFTNFPLTQRIIIQSLYINVDEDEILLDDFYEKLLLLHGEEFIQSRDELFYRLKVLMFYGYLDLLELIPRKTYIARINSIRDLLKKHNLLNYRE